MVLVVFHVQAPYLGDGWVSKGGEGEWERGETNGVRVALGKDVLARGTGCTDTVDGSLVEVEHQSLVHVVVFVIGVEDNPAVGLELPRELVPEALEVGGRGDDGAVEAAVVVRVHHGVGARVGDGVDGRRQVGQVGGVEGGRDRALDHALHREGDAEHVVALLDEGLESGQQNV